MTRLRQSITILILALTAFFSIQWLSVIDSAMMGIEPFVYFLGLLAVLSMLWNVKKRRRPLFMAMAFWVAVYILLKLFVFKERPLINGIHTFVSLTSIIFLILLSWLAHRCSLALNEFENAIVVFNGQRLGVTPATTRNPYTISQIEAEMARSRSFARPLSVVSFSIEGAEQEQLNEQFMHELQTVLRDQYATQRLTAILDRWRRRTDMLIFDPAKQEFLLLCPETDAANARDVARELSAVLQESLSVSPKWGVASFPHEALTFEELCELARNQRVSENVAENQQPSYPLVAHTGDAS